jgi:hypothetical protein
MKQLSAGVQKEICARVQKETILQGIISEDFGPSVEGRCRSLGDRPELAQGMMDERDARAFGWGDPPATSQKVDLVVGVDPSFQMERQMQIQEGGWRTGTREGALLGKSFLPGGIGAQAGGAAAGGILALHLALEHALGGGIAGDFFIGQDGDQTFLQGAKAAFDLAFGLRAGRDPVGYAQGGKGALELGTGIPVIGHGIMAKETQAIGVNDQRQAVLQQEAAKMFEVIPSGVGGDEDRAQELAGMIIHGKQQGLLGCGRPPLVNGGIVLPQFVEAGAFPAAAGFGAWFRLAEEVGKVVSGKGGHRLAMALKTEAGFQFVGDELEVGWLLEGEELLEESDGCWRPVRPMVTPGEPGGEGRPVLEETGAEPVKVGPTDLQVVGGIHGVNQPFIELPEDLLEKQVGEAVGDLLFL